MPCIPSCKHVPLGSTQVNICDAEIAYMYEYIGNPGCLCITPLTDRCYITLTQAQRLVLGELWAASAGALQCYHIVSHHLLARRHAM